MPSGQTEYTQRRFDNDGIRKRIQLLKQREPFEIFFPRRFDDIHIGPRTRIQSRFFGNDISAVRAKVFEEIGEFEEALAGDKSYTVGNGDTPAAGIGVEADSLRHSEEEFGDILFALVNWARHLHIDPAVALERANAKFRKRFTYVENECRDRGIEMKKENLQTMDALWDEAKHTL